MSSETDHYIHFYGCKVLVQDASTKDVLDPCNCSSFYTQKCDNGLAKERLVCDEGQLWNHIVNQCRPSQTVLDRKLCKKEAPWERCIDLPEHKALDLKNNCIEKGFYIPAVGDKASKNFALPHSTQMANTGLLVMSMVAGSLITLLIVALVLTYFDISVLDTKLSRCSGSCPCTSGGASKKTEDCSNITEGDHMSVNYEDIDDDEDTLNSGYRPMGADGPVSFNPSIPRQRPAQTKPPSFTNDNSGIAQSPKASTRPPMKAPPRQINKPPPKPPSDRPRLQLKPLPDNTPNSHNNQLGYTAANNRPKKPPVVPKKLSAQQSDAYLHAV